MAKINVLPRGIFELIAAGEVVERPSSAVKELLENSIDAGASSVTLEINNGGIRYIRITDNGCGIARDDVKNAFRSHATSKISVASDLDSVSTLGFRGEALASIAAVSKVEMLTRAADEAVGTRCIVEGGELLELDDAGCPSGTTIVIRDLFYNVPARMKFLKKDMYEANSVAAVAERVALSHPEVSLRFIRDGKEVFFAPGDNKLLSAIYAVFGKQFADGLTSLTGKNGRISVNGYVSVPLAARATRNMQLFFVNGRFVKTKTAAAALEQACKGSVMVGKFPACVINILMPCDAVDVNVHPAKTEVRFASEKELFDAVYYAVKSSLDKDVSRPKADFGGAASGGFFGMNDRPVQVKLPDIMPVQPRVTTTFTVAAPEQTPYSAGGEPSVLDSCVTAQPSKITTPEKPEAILPEPESFRVVGEVFKTYIIVEQGDKLLLIDKHAAHERMIFEELKSQAGNIPSQILIAPLTVQLSKEEYSALTENLAVLADAGFEIEDFGSGTAIVRAYPAILDGSDIEAQVVEIAGALVDKSREVSTEKIDWIFHSAACRAAVKAGDFTSQYEMEKFASKLFSMPEIRFCPHGRPIVSEMSRRSIEKLFGRIQ